MLNRQPTTRSRRVTVVPGGRCSLPPGRAGKIGASRQGRILGAHSLAKRTLTKVTKKAAHVVEKRPVPEVKSRAAKVPAKMPVPEVKVKEVRPAAARPRPEVKKKEARVVEKRPVPEVKKKVTHGPKKGPAPKTKEKAGRPVTARPQTEVKAKVAPGAVKRPAAQVKAAEGRSAATAPRPEVKRRGRSLAGRIAGVAASSFLGLTLVTLAFLLLAPRIWDLKFFTVVGGSMEPTIPLGAVVAIRPVDANDIKVNDIIMYGGPQSSSRSASVVHRVIAVEATAEGEPTFVTRGDSNGSEDYLMVAAEDVVGRVWFHIPYLGYVRGYGQTQPLFLAMIGLPAMALTGMEIAGLVRHVRRARRERGASNGQLKSEGPVHPQQPGKGMNGHKSPRASGRPRLGPVSGCAGRIPRPRQATGLRLSRPKQKVRTG